MQNILFICSANKDRSKTAEDYFGVKFPLLNFDSAGTNKKICRQLGTEFIGLDQITWADIILVMEEKHAHFIKTNFQVKTTGKIKVLHIKDHYLYNQPELISVLEQKVNPQLINLV
jgi:predicted protein tyrosine phosphatase